MTTTLLLAITVLVLMMQWPQPTNLILSALKANDKAKVINRIEDAIKHCARVSLHSLKLQSLLIVILTIQVFGTLIASALRCVQPPRRRRQKHSRWWRAGERELMRVASGIGDWIERVTAPSSQTRRRRIHRTVTRYRSTSRVMAMSVLAMQANATISTERESRFDTDSGLVGIDNRCSACISHEPSDFDGPLEKSNRVIKGFGGSRTTNIKVGTLKWSWEDDQGAITTFRIPNSYYVPDGKVRLLSPQHWAQTQTTTRNNVPSRGCREYTDGDRCVLTWHGGTSQRTIPLGKRDNVATFTLAPGYSNFEAFCCEADLTESMSDPIALPSGIISDDEDAANSNDADAVHDPIPWQETWRAPATPTAQPDIVPDEATPVDFSLNGPITSASEGGRTASEGEPTSQINVITDEEDRQPSDLAELLMLHHQYGHISMRKLQEMAKQGILPKRLATCRIPTCSACLYSKATRRPWRGKTSKQWKEEGATAQRPGQVVSVDQLVSPTPGLIAQMTGFLTTKRYKYATVFVDQFSRLGFVYLQKTASAEETIEGKKAFEAFAKRHGVSVSNYHADNGIFKAHQWMNACRKDQQGMSFAGVNAHHQNGHAERRIRELQELARAMLIHASTRWKDSVTAYLWPYAIRNANEAVNNTPSFQDPKRRTPIDLFAGTKVSSNPKHWKPFGSPTYVLENELQGQRPFHKWRHRSKPGVYLGKSPQHGRNVSLVLSRETGLVSPQFHVAFDPTFDTVKDMTTKSMWQIRAGFVTQREHTNRENRPEKTTDPAAAIAPPTGSNKRKRSESKSKAQVRRTSSRETTERAAANVGGDGLPILQNEEGASSGVDNKLIETTTRSGRKAKPAPRLIEAMATEIAEITSHDVIGEIFCYVAMFPDNDEIDWDEPLLAYKAVSDPDTLYYHQAMREKDHQEFRSSMLREVTDQFENGNFTIVHKTEVPSGETVLPAVWQMRRKRDAKTGEIKKYKARLNIDGSRMKKGEHYDMTYSPVASWNSVRMLLTLTALHGWHTKQIDFVQAFAQAPIEKTLYMKIPAGVDLECGSDTRDYVLKLHRNIYGQKQAGRVWNQYLVSKLVKDLGFKQSKVDECVFYRGKTLYVLYTDDSLLAGPDRKEIDRIIEELQTKAKLAITVEGDLADFLGVNIDRRNDGTIHLSQPHLIDQILSDLRLDSDNVKVRSTPAASSKLLTRHTKSSPFDNSFNYRSVIGKLNYLEKATRSDISYAVHQCARFVSDPKVEHGEAVRWLGRYLKGTRDRGTVMTPIQGKELEVYVDASFCGDWDPAEAAQDRDTARSRHGYIINYAGCPLLWKSQLQTEVALSSTESEYTGLSYALRDAIPIMQLLKEMQRKGFPIHSPQARVHCHVFEDNSGALEMAKIHKYRPRTKHLNVRLHHFRDYVERKEISIHPISTHDQPADFLTKALNEETLRKHRRAILGW